MKWGANLCDNEAAGDPVHGPSTSSPTVTVTKPNNLDDLNVKVEDVAECMKNDQKTKRFTQEEDKALRAAVAKYGSGKWAIILKDDAFKFHPCRTRDTLRIRAMTLGITKNKGKKK